MTRLRLIAIAAAIALLGIAAPARAASGRASEAPLLLDMAPVTVPILRGPHMEGSVHLQLSLRLSDRAAAKQATRLTPRLEAAYLTALRRLAVTHFDPGRTADLDLVSKVLQARTDQILGPGAARLLIKESAVRR